MKIEALRTNVNLQELVKYSHESDACIDLVSCKTLVIPENKWSSVPTGIAVEFPAAYFGLILGRSGFATYKGADVLGGVVDNGYRGEIYVTLANYSTFGSIRIYEGDRIAQMAVLPYFKAKLEWVDEIKRGSDRGVSGHGSTGN